MTIDEQRRAAEAKYDALIEEARAIARTILDCRSAEEVHATCLRVKAAQQRAADFVDQTVALLRAESDDLPSC